jgi:hypothetical protein
MNAMRSSICVSCFSSRANLQAAQSLIPSSLGEKRIHEEVVVEKSERKAARETEECEMETLERRARDGKWERSQGRS